LELEGMGKRKTSLFKSRRQANFVLILLLCIVCFLAWVAVCGLADSIKFEVYRATELLENSLLDNGGNWDKSVEDASFKSIIKVNKEFDPNCFKRKDYIQQDRYSQGNLMLIDGPYIIFHYRELAEVYNTANLRLYRAIMEGRNRKNSQNDNY
jgi:hypothetical protein